MVYHWVSKPPKECHGVANMHLDEKDHVFERLLVLKKDRWVEVR